MKESSQQPPTVLQATLISLLGGGLIGVAIAHTLESQPTASSGETREYVIDTRIRIQNGQAELKKIRLVEMPKSTGSAYKDVDDCEKTLFLLKEQQHYYADEDHIACEELTIDEGRALPLVTPSPVP